MRGKEPGEKGREDKWDVAGTDMLSSPQTMGPKLPKLLQLKGRKVKLPNLWDKKYWFERGGNIQTLSAAEKALRPHMPSEAYFQSEHRGDTSIPDPCRLPPFYIQAVHPLCNPTNLQGTNYVLEFNHEGENVYLAVE